MLHLAMVFGTDPKEAKCRAISLSERRSTQGSLAFQKTAEFDAVQFLSDVISIGWDHPGTT
jgi:hypothetical protein